MCGILYYCRRGICSNIASAAKENQAAADSHSAQIDTTQSSSNTTLFTQVKELGSQVS